MAKTIMLDKIDSGNFMAWQVTTNCFVAVEVVLHDDSTEYFKAEKPQGTPGFRQLVQGGAAYGGKGLQLTIKNIADDQYVFQHSEDLITSGGVVVGHAYNFCVEDGKGRGEDMDDIYINIMSWKKNEYPPKEPAAQTDETTSTIHIANPRDPSSTDKNPFMSWLVTSQSQKETFVKMWDTERTYFDIHREYTTRHGLEVHSQGGSHIPYDYDIILTLKTEPLFLVGRIKLNTPILNKDGTAVGEIYNFCYETGVDGDYNDFCVVVVIWYNPD